LLNFSLEKPVTKVTGFLLSVILKYTLPAALLWDCFMVKLFGTIDPENSFYLYCIINVLILDLSLPKLLS
jgi:hypothetical protein